MNKAIKIFAHAGIATLLSLTACDNKSVAEADKDAAKAVDKHSDAVDHAKREASAEEQKELSAANEELAEDITDAYKNVEPAPTAGERLADRTTPTDDADAKELSPEKRFALNEAETTEEFAARAKTTLAALDSDLAKVKKSNVPADDVQGVADQLAEARKDLDEVTRGSDDVLDDGKLGVTVAINSARRKLDRIAEDLAKTK